MIDNIAELWIILPMITGTSRERFEVSQSSSHNQEPKVASMLHFSFLPQSFPKILLVILTCTYFPLLISKVKKSKSIHSSCKDSVLYPYNLTPYFRGIMNLYCKFILQSCYRMTFSLDNIWKQKREGGGTLQLDPESMSKAKRVKNSTLNQKSLIK